MFDAIIFDFGEVFLDLNPEAMTTAFQKLGLKEWTVDLQHAHEKFEKGKMDELTFFELIQNKIPEADLWQIKEAWNAIIVDFPLKRLEFLQKLQSKYRLYLLSNTNETHIDKFEHRVGLTFAREFYACFEKVYFSFDIGFIKPELDAFRYVLQNHHLSPKKTLFVDDKIENIQAANQLELQTWHLQVGKEDVTDLFSVFNI
jgi:glucose-1-phosphatase